MECLSDETHPTSFGSLVGLLWNSAKVRSASKTPIVVIFPRPT